jgi:hypothetical protein
MNIVTYLILLVIDASRCLFLRVKNTKYESYGEHKLASLLSFGYVVVIKPSPD